MMRGFRISSSTLLLAAIVADLAAGMLLHRSDALTAQSVAYLAVQAALMIAVIRRTGPAVVDSNWRSNLACAWCWLYPYAALMVMGQPSSVPATVTSVILVLAALLALASIVALDRSFGLRPARRRLVTRGPYAAIRHPLYASYIVADCAICLAYPSVGIVALMATGWGAICFRMRAEERVLAEDPGWTLYRSAVRYRLWPGVI
jgi:protein-S-isoprenylcysteine O-methyltransferase Ste14